MRIWLDARVAWKKEIGEWGGVKLLTIFFILLMLIPLTLLERLIFLFTFFLIFLFTFCPSSFSFHFFLDPLLYGSKNQHPSCKGEWLIIHQQRHTRSMRVCWKYFSEAIPQCCARWPRHIDKPYRSLSRKPLQGRPETQFRLSQPELSLAS